MLKQPNAALLLILIFFSSLISDVSFAKWKRPVTHIFATPRVKAKKYVYQVESNDVKPVQAGKLLPSQVAIGTRSVSRDGAAVRLKGKRKAQRSIASEAN